MSVRRKKQVGFVLFIVALALVLWPGQKTGAVLPLLTINAPTTFASLDNGPDDQDPAVGVFRFCGDLTIANGGSITCDDPALPTAASACPINIVLLGSLEIQAGGSIHADNNIDGGLGGDISLTIGGDFTMRGPTVPGGSDGAFVSSQKKSGGSQEGGDILILVGGVTTTPDPTPGQDPNNPSPAIGVCDSPVICGVTIPANTGNALIELGATIISDSASGRAGDIALYTGRNITVHGTVVARGFTTGGHGGAITLDACCDLLIGDTGVVSSQGQDPGPDRVHVEACVVTIFGLVQSTGPAHGAPQFNCIPPERPDKPAISTACVEIWSGTTLTIDSTGTHHAEVHADVGFSGGSSGQGWIDILANGNIVLNDGAGNDGANPIIPSPASDYLVHANMGLGNGRGGIILVQSKFGSVSTFGDAIQANNTAAGGGGGTITVQAGGTGSPAGDVLFDSASIQAMGLPAAVAARTAASSTGAPSRGTSAAREASSTPSVGPVLVSLVARSLWRPAWGRPTPAPPRLRSCSV
jgi:hypothetical protein